MKIKVGLFLADVMRKAWVIAGSIGAHETLCLLLNISCPLPVVWCLMSYVGKMVIYHAKFSKEMQIWICAHTHIHTRRLIHWRGAHVLCSFLIYIFLGEGGLHSRSHTTFSRVNILALKKSKLKQEQESGVNGVSLKKLSFSSPPDSAPFLPRILMLAEERKRGEMTETPWTLYVRDTGQLSPINTINPQGLKCMLFKVLDFFFSLKSNNLTVLDYQRRKKRWEVNDRETRTKELFTYTSFKYLNSINSIIIKFKKKRSEVNYTFLYMVLEVDWLLCISSLFKQLKVLCTNVPVHSTYWWYI